MIVPKRSVSMAGAVQFLEAELVRTILEAVVFLLCRSVAALLALTLVPIGMLKELINRLHVRIDSEPISIDVEVKLVNSSVERQPIDDSLFDEVLPEVNGTISHGISVLLNDIDQIPEHIALRALDLNRVHVRRSNGRTVVGMMLRQVRVHPNPDLPLFGEEDHLLSDVEIANLLIQYLEALQAALVEIELICQRYVVDLLQPQIHLLGVEQAVVDGGAEFCNRCVGEVLDLVHVRRAAVRLVLNAQQLDPPRRRVLSPQLHLPRVAVEVLLAEELQFVLLNDLLGIFVDQQPFPVGIDVVKERTVGILDSLDPTVQLDALTLQSFAISLPHAALIIKIIIKHPTGIPLHFIQSMSKNFEYNFTTENELVDLRERIAELEEENTLLKESLEELIKVNTELTESIEEFNNQNPNAQQQNQQISQMAEAIQAQEQQIQSLRQELQRSRQIEARTQKKMPSEVAGDMETESLVNVLEELVESFKNMQNRYESEIQEFERSFEEYKNHFEQELGRIRGQYQQKLNTLEPIITQLRRKDENLWSIQEKITQLERGTRHASNGQAMKESGRVLEQNRRLKGELELRERQIQGYKNVLERLKAKFNERL